MTDQLLSACCGAPMTVFCDACENPAEPPTANEPPAQPDTPPMDAPDPQPLADMPPDIDALRTEFEEIGRGRSSGWAGIRALQLIDTQAKDIERLRAEIAVALSSMTDYTSLARANDSHRYLRTRLQAALSGDPGFGLTEVVPIERLEIANDVAVVLNALTRAEECHLCYQKAAHVHSKTCALGRWAQAGGDKAARITEAKP